MVTSLAQKKKAGNIFDFIGLQEIQDGVLSIQRKRQEREYKAILAIDPVNFSLMEENEQEIILEGFRVFVQRLQVHQNISIHIQIRPYDIQPYLETLQEAQESPSSIIRELSRDHEEFVLSLASQHAILQRRFYIRVATQPEKRAGRKKLKPVALFDRAKTQLDIICSGLLEDIKRASLSGHRLNDQEIAQYYLECVHTHYAEEHPVQPTNLQAVNRPLMPVRLKEIVQADTTELALTDREEQEAGDDTATVPPLSISTSEQTGKRSFFARGIEARKTKQGMSETAYHVQLAELLAPSMITEEEHFIKIYRERTEYFRARSVTGYPSYVIAGWLDRLIQIDEPYIDIVLYLETLESTKYVNKLTRQITGYRATQTVDENHGRVENPHIKVAREEVETLRDQLVQQTERVHTFSLYICTRASSPSELSQRDEQLVETLRSLDLESVELSLEHLQGWLCVLPDSYDVLKRGKLLETSSVVTAFPFSSASLSTEPGALVGVMPSGGLVIMNPLSEQLDNGHELTIARSGAGKSYHEKVWLMRMLIQGFDALVIDPEDEYAPLCQKFRGVNVRLASGRLQLNPFDLPLVTESDRNSLEEKFQSLLVLFDLLLAEKDPGMLTQREKAFLTRCFAQVYADRGITRDASTHHHTPPCMRDLYTVILGGECGQDTFDLGDRLLRHLEAFPLATEIQMDNPLIVFNTRDLADDLRAVGLFLATDFFWTQIRRERHPRPRILTIDEAWTLLEFPEGGRFLESMSRRARKYNVMLRLKTQQTEDFLASNEGRTIIANSATKFLMKQSAESIDLVVRAFRLSEGERKFLLTCNPGEGLYYSGLSHVPLRVVASATEHKIATTNQQELLREEMQTLARQQQTESMRDSEALAVQQSRDEYSIVFPRFYQNGETNGNETV